MSAHLRGRTSKLVVSISGACTAVLAQADAHKPHQSQQPFGLRGTALGTTCGNSTTISFASASSLSPECRANVSPTNERPWSQPWKAMCRRQRSVAAWQAVGT